MGLLDALTDPVRERMKLLIITALGLFLAIQYSVLVTELFETYFPAGDTPIGKVGFLIILTFIIVYLIVFIERVFGEPKK
jgi:uncharacterized membrane protein required for colicin V production